MIRLKDIEAAHNRIEKYIYHTPLEKSMELSIGDGNVFLKLENQQKTGAYKLRGALSKLTSLTEEELVKGIGAISSGNHGAAVSYGANLLGIKSPHIFVPEITPKSKIQKINYYGGNVIKLGKNYDEVHQEGMKMIKENDYSFIDPCSDEVVIAGQGSIALEILEENPQIDTILVPIGGGGIITGVSIAAKAINPKIKIIGVQTAACPAMLASLRDQVFYESYESQESICDALVGGVGYIPYSLASETIDDIILVEEEDIRRAVKHLLLKEKTVAEPAGAIGVGALLSNPKFIKGKSVAVVITGGNIDEELLKEIVGEAKSLKLRA